MSTKPKLGTLGIYAIAYLAFIYIPVLFLPLFSFNDAIFTTFPLRGFTVKWYGEAFASAGMMKSLLNSLKVGIPVAFISTVLGTLGAKVLTRYQMPGKAPVMGFILIPLVIPGIIIGIALLLIINFIGLELSLYTIAFSHLPECTAFSIWIMMSRLEGFDKSVEEASLDLGMNGWQTFWRITFPLIFPGIIASLLLTFTISFDEFILAFFLAGNDATLPLYIWSQLRFPTRLPGVLALGSMILAASFILVTVAELFRRSGPRMKTSSGV